MSASDDDFVPVGFDPAQVSGYDEDGATQGAESDLDSAVPRVFDAMPPDLDVVEESEMELDLIAAGFRERKEIESERHELATNSDYWFCVCFATKAQRDAFLDAAHWRDLGYRYLDGRQIAHRMGVDLPPDPAWPKATRTRSWDDLAMTVAENRDIDTEEGGHSGRTNRQGA